MDMYFQRTKEAMRDAPATQEEGSDYPLEAYGGGGHSKNSPKNDSSLDHHHDPHREDPVDLSFNCRSAQLSYSHDPSQALPPPSQISAATPPPSSGAIYIPSSLGLNAREHRLLLESRVHPPVTKQTLSELDLPCIMSNINLRMDANFDRDLHFKPDLDGEKGKRKRREATDYWQAMAAEISIYEYNACHGLEDLSGDDRDGTDQRQTFVPRLPAMLETLQDVLNTLVPERDHPSVMQNLDVSLLMQQIRKGVLDMVGLANWLATLLKTHCAPMRDQWADLMVEQISLGSQSQNPLGIVNGLQTLFAILEAMKLVSHWKQLVSRITDSHRTLQTIRSAPSASSSSKTPFLFFGSIFRARSRETAFKWRLPDPGTWSCGTATQTEAQTASGRSR